MDALVVKAMAALGVNLLPCELGAERDEDEAMFGRLDLLLTELADYMRLHREEFTPTVLTALKQVTAVLDLAVAELQKSREQRS